MLQVLEALEAKFPKAAEHLDAAQHTDRATLRELQVDGRIPYADLGPKVGLSPSAARLRLQPLIDAKVVQVVGVTDPMTMGRQAMALLRLCIDGDPRAVADELSRHAEVVCSHPRDLLDFINDVVRPVEGVASVESFPYFAIHTHRFMWEVD